ncbi:fibrobacter succinogenes major paralogous domain-containing protein [Saccharicrinis sp. FJH2]|uniref:fibrobacter succinogenes major paralogous domain-containing protein n=1 Tax=Saccharicrinis sp. FJH65 TaxID=3344659 RepID=UPI0035F22751
MKNITNLTKTVLVLFTLLFTYNCSKDDDEKVEIPTVTTIGASEITQTSALCGGEIISNGGADITSRGLCWNTKISPTIDDNIILENSDISKFSNTITGLKAYSKYYVRAYATNSAGTGYGYSYSFITAWTDSLEDIEGNIYKIIKIGDQAWMAENLRTTKYNDGTAIPNVTVDTIWSNLTTAAYCNYDNDENIGLLYGRLYNGFTINTSKLCPEGWHVPSEDDWLKLDNYLIENGYSWSDIVGYKWEIGKSLSSTSGWKESGYKGDVGNNQASNNTSGFNALPVGARGENGHFVAWGTNSALWSTTVSRYHSDITRVFFLVYNQPGHFSIDIYNQYGYGVRCVKNDF